MKTDNTCVASGRENSDAAENGYVFVFVLAVLTVLMLTGLFISNTAVNEQQLCRNEAQVAQNKAAAEATANAMVQRLQNIPMSEKQLLISKWNPETDTGIPGMNESNSAPEDINHAEFENHILKKRGETGSLTYHVIGWEPAQGASLSAHADSLQQCTIKAAYESKNGRANVDVGFMKRF